jgi:hypothetical protein
MLVASLTDTNLCCRSVSAASERVAARPSERAKVDFIPGDGKPRYASVAAEGFRIMSREPNSCSSA